MPLPQSFKVPTEDWKFLEHSSSQIYWVNKTIPDLMMQRYGLNPPNDLPPDYPNIVSHRAMFEEFIAKEKGAVISVDFLIVKNLEAFQTIFKFRMPKNSLGMRYLGTLMFPFENFFCGFTFQCDEYGTTGMREAMVYSLENVGKKSEPNPDSPPPPVLTGDDFFDRIKQSPVTQNPSDDAKYDQLIPVHPLSRTRRYLRWLAAAIEFDEEVLKAKPYRGIETRTSTSRFGKFFKRK